MGPRDVKTFVEELRERAKFAREEKTGTALGDALAFEAAADRIDADADDAATMRGFLTTHHMTPSMVVSLMKHWQRRALAAEGAVRWARPRLSEDAYRDQLDRQYSAWAYQTPALPDDELARAAGI